jgi:hypothetical protein
MTIVEGSVSIMGKWNFPQEVAWIKIMECISNHEYQISKGKVSQG